MATVRFIYHENRNTKKQLDRLPQLPGSSVLGGRAKFTANTTLNLLYMSILQRAFGDNDPEDYSLLRIPLLHPPSLHP